MSLAMKVARGEYQGDPGLWGFVKGAARAGAAYLTGGTSEVALQAISQARGGGAPPPVSAISRRAPSPRRTTWPTMFGATTPQGAPPPSREVVRTPGIRGAIQRAAPGGATGYQVAAAPPMMMNGKMGGYHLNKSSYFLISGEFVPAGTRWVKNRRRNPGNIKAASRALSRVTATKKALQTFSKVTIRDKDAVKTKTVYKCVKCGYAKCRC